MLLTTQGHIGVADVFIATQAGTAFKADSCTPAALPLYRVYAKLCCIPTVWVMAIMMNNYFLIMVHLDLPGQARYR